MPYELGAMVPWPLLPNWKGGISESLEFRTKVIGPTLTGVRQKRRMRTAPRRSFEFDVLPNNDGQKLIDNLRFGQGKREWALPIWHDRQSLQAPLSLGSTVIPCATTGYDFATHALLRHRLLNTFEFEVVEIGAIAVDGLTLVNPTTLAWDTSTRLYPLRRAVLSEFPRSQVYTTQVSTMRVRFDLVETCDWTPYTFASSYLGWPVWEFKNDWGKQVNLGFDRVITTVDNDTSIPTYYDLPDVAFASQDMRWMAHKREANTLLRSVLYALAGRYTSIWLPTGIEDLKLSAAVGSADTTISVRKCGYTLFGMMKPGRRDIRIELYDGTIYYRRITGSAEAGDNETLTINAALGASVSIAAVKIISFMSLAEQSSDAINLQHETDADGVTTAALVFEGVIEPPAT